MECPVPENVLVGRFTGFETNLPVMAAWQVIKPEKEIYIEMINPTLLPVHLCHGQPIADVADRNVEIKNTGMMRNLNSSPKMSTDNNRDHLVNQDQFGSMGGSRVDPIVTDFFQDSHEDLVDEFSMDRPRDGAQFCKFTPLFSDSLTQADWELHQEDKMSDPGMDWIPPSIPSSPDPHSPPPTFQSTGDVLSGPPERDKLEDFGIEDIIEPRLASVQTIITFCKRMPIL